MARADAGVPAGARAYQGRRAGAVTRVAAAAVDLVILVGLIALLYGTIIGVRFILHPRQVHWPSGFGWSLPLVGFLIAVPYLTLAWCTTGRSGGDALFGLRVVNRSGNSVHFVPATARAVLCVIFPVGLFWCVLSRGRLSVQDILLRTAVVYDWKRLDSVGTDGRETAPTAPARSDEVASSPGNEVSPPRTHNR